MRPVALAVARRLAIGASVVLVAGTCSGTSVTTSVPTAGAPVGGTPVAAATAGATTAAAESGPSLAAATPAAGGSAAIAGLQTCADDARWQCGSQEVPLDWAAPAGPGLQIAFALLPHLDRNQAPLETVFAVDGGPGFSGMQDRSRTALTSLRARHDLVAFDQRGTGASDPIVCQDLQDGFGSIAELRTATAACGTQLGDAADRYGSGDAARDLEAIRARLGLPSIDIYTVSYGSVVGVAYAARYAERLHALVIDSGLLVTDPAHARGWGLGYPRAWIDIIIRLCDRDASCAATHPDVGGLLERLVARVRGKPLKGTVDGTETVADEAHVATLLGNVGPHSAITTASQLLDAAASVLEHGDPGAFLQLIHDVGFWPGDSGPASSYSAGLSAAAGCNDQDFVFDRTDPTTVREGKLRDAVAALPPDAFEPVSVAGWMEYQWPQGCLDWPAPDRFEPVIPAGVTLPDIPVLVLSGDIDGIVISDNARAVAAAFPHATFAAVRNVDHNFTIFDDNGCEQQLIAGYLQSLKADPDACNR